MTMKPTICITVDEQNPYSTLFQMMVQRGIPGTFFVNPDDIGVSVTVDILSIMKINGWTIGAYSGQNLVNLLSVGDRPAVMARLAHIKSSMLAMGFNPRCLAPNERAWNGALRNLASGLFEKVRVATGGDQPIPIPDPLYIRYGGTASLGINDTIASINADFDAFLAQSQPGLWMPVIHKVGTVPDSHTVHPDVITALLDRTVSEQSLGNVIAIGMDNLPVSTL